MLMTMPAIVMVEDGGDDFSDDGCDSDGGGR